MNIKTQFIFKLITKYFIYGYLCIFGIVRARRFQPHETAYDFLDFFKI